MQTYHLTHVADPGSNSPRAALGKITEVIIPSLVSDGHRPWGIFAGLFGLATNELYLVTASDAESGVPAALIDDAGLHINARIDLVPTARPTAFTPPSTPGIYVFRWFDVKNKDVDEIAEISRKAWVSFEGGFDSRIQGLFAESNRSSPEGKMILVTWYRNLTVWEESRRPSEEATQLFTRRHELTLRATPVATRLIPLR